MTRRARRTPTACRCYVDKFSRRAVGVKITQVAQPSGHAMTGTDLLAVLLAPFVGLVGAATGFYCGTKDPR
jgi:hypothetical protein